MQTQLQRIEVKTMLAGDHDFAVENTAGWQSLRTYFVQVGKVTVERPMIAALDEDLAPLTKYKRAKAIPLRLVKKFAFCRQLDCKLRKHRIDRRIGCRRVGDSAPNGVFASGRFH